MSDECPSHTTTINIYLTCVGIHAGLGIENIKLTSNDAYVLPHMRILSHTRMGRPICVYSYGTPIRVWDSILSHMSILFACFISYRSLDTAAINRYT